MSEQKRKLLIIAFFFPPENNGGTERVKQFYNRLRGDNFDTYVFTADKRIRDIRKKRKRDNKIIYSWIIWMCLRVYYKLIREFKFECKLLYSIVELLVYNKFKVLKPDICIASFPPVFDFDVGLILKKKMGTKLVADFRDGLLYEPFEGVLNANNKEKEKYSTLETNIAKQANLIITVTPQITKYITTGYQVDAYTITNGFDDEEVIKDPPVELPKNKKNVVYTGALNMSRSGQFEYVKNCFEYVFKNNEDVVFSFIGNYTDEETSFFKRFNNVIVFKQRKRSEIIATQRIADMLLLVTGDAEGGTSGKLYEYLFTDKPILNIGGDNNARKIIEETSSGYTIHSSCIEDINLFIKETLKKDNAYKRYNIEKYTRKVICEELEKMLLRI